MAKEKILVIEDEEDILELLEYNLRKEGYAVSCVTSGEDGLSRKMGGAGLGLAIVKHIAHAHSGIAIVTRCREV